MLRKLNIGDANILLYEKKHTKKYEFVEHYHDVYQIVYAIEGSGSIRLDRNDYPLMQDDVAIITPYTNHIIRSEFRLTLLVIAFSDISFLGPELAAPLFGGAKVINFSGYEADEIKRLLRKMMYEQNRKSELYVYALRCHLTEILLTFYRALKTRCRSTDANFLRAESIRSYIDTHFFENFLLSKNIPDQLNISIRYADNIFKEYYQMTPRQYLTEVRIGHAKNLLSETDKDIVTVCFEVGYENLSTFYRTFKNVTGMSPKKFRSLNKNAPVLAKEG
ncbi:AraC family transcriptional regulator [Paenibacillus hamazuiensis]|uniref:AraC family transcriptional regulator n=1 Tax=Paenibacillus hamazuiensis TaxID=2936508 RepID=UPI0020106C73|nr:AraC family transcriptional regulator [Paenibacillus hamazuiensis]